MGTKTPVTIFDCAALSANVYQPGTSTGAPVGWEPVTRLSAGNGTTGFYGLGYRRFDDLIIAIRGTSDADDAVHDLRMIPVGVTPDMARSVMNTLICEWENRRNLSAGNTAFSGLAMFAFSRRGTAPAVAAFANQVPNEQANPARTLAITANGYAFQHRLRLRAFVGHSMGGGIAQYLAEQTGPGGEVPIPITPAVSFNGPYMGNLKGMRKGKGGGVLICNTKLDPLSRVTDLVGNACHASEGCKFDLSPPAMAERPPYDDGKQKAPNDPYLRAYRDWFAKAAIHYHSITKLAAYLAENDPGGRRLSDFFKPPASRPLVG
jgi:hypothetical protein